MATKIRVPRVRWLPRQRLDRLLGEVWQHRLTLVVAPAGSGKTTLLACWSTAAAATGDAVAWYRAEPTDAHEDALLECLQQSIAGAFALEPGPPWRSADDAAGAIERSSPRRLLLIVDDEHVLAGSPAEAVLERLAGILPPDAAMVLAGRTAPGFELSRARVSGELLEIGGDDLRFRSWEVEGLFRDFYGEALSADELARLARRTEGWAAGLQLFHLATQGKPAPMRRSLLENLASGSRLMREYLTRNVVNELPPEQRDFLVRTCVLRRLTGPLCDRLLDACGSRALLDALERAGVFTVALDDAGTFRYHEVLRGHLEGVLVEEIGETAARALSARAGELLEADGAMAEAIAAYCRAGAWDRVALAVGSDASRLDAGPPFWLDLVPGPLVEQDPWLMLSIARALRSQGRWREALAAFEKAERAFGAADGGIAARRERRGLAAFMGAPPAPVPGWPGILRSALTADPAAAARTPEAGAAEGLEQVGAGRAGETLARGFAELLGGYVRRARAILRPLADEPDAPEDLAAAARLGAAVAGWLSAGAATASGAGHRRGNGTANRPGSAGGRDAGGGDANGAAPNGAAANVAANANGAGSAAGNGATNSAEYGPTAPETLDELERAVADAERLGLDWLARVGSAVRALVDAGASSGDRVASLRVDADLRGDRWTALVACLIQGTAAFEVQPGIAIEAFDAAADLAAAVGAHTVEGWARAAGALAAARKGSADAADRATVGERLCRVRRVAGGRALALRALELTDPAHAAEHRALAGAIAEETGLGGFWPELGATGTSGPRSEAAGAAGREQGRQGDGPPPPVEICLFGQFQIAILGVRLDLRALKPRSRAVLHRLAVDAGRPVHREILQAAFWPEADPDTAARNLHVALSALRHELRYGPDGSLIERDGEAYRLLVPPGGRVDLTTFWEAASQGRQARTHGRSDEAIERLSAALEIAGTELLPEDGPADWLVERREQVAHVVAEAARSLAELLISHDPDAAARACTAGLRADPHADALWRLLVDAHERAGDAASAASTRRSYSDLLASLELDGAGESGRPSATRASAADD